MTIYVPYELGEQFVRFVGREGRKISAAAADAIRLYLLHQRKGKGRISATAQETTGAGETSTTDATGESCPEPPYHRHVARSTSERP